MELQTILSQNLQEYRKRLGLTQDQIASFLEVDRSLITRFEIGDREISYPQLKKLSHLFNVEVEDLLEVDSAKREANFAFAFRSEGLDSMDLKSIADFQRVVRNYIEMSRIQHEEK
jgi:transcriptional regulator with XRE-family HTH domain